MKDSKMLNNIKNIKETLLNDGFIIDGIFGSYARGENRQDSDVDILYHLDERFYTKYSGFFGFKKLDDIKSSISKKLNKKVDLAPLSNLSKSAKKHILKDVVYV